MENNQVISSRAIQNDKYEPTGNQDVRYPQIVIRTNRTPERTDMNDVIKKADTAADQYPFEDKENRAKAVTQELTKEFGSGRFGHTWIIIFNSNKKGDATTYGYHEKYGFVKNGTAGDRNDNPERKFHVERVLPLDENMTTEKLEKEIIPALNEQSAEVGKIMGIPIENPSNGAYTPINNCAWFAGNVWNSATNNGLLFTQNFDGVTHGNYWGMPFLSMVKEIADPGMVAESLAAF
ncbi:hypothetical protein BCR23_13360 [Enterococcus quebecensis]|uniref:Uncharacterized protein n=1 Tax=Enterococcus quebecensis TaxID=903983 RepID=A0A1E5H1C3_9ENTE|nr:hypothetical protein BCR23_13360 [Enterococcus quebecensis]